MRFDYLSSKSLFLSFLIMLSLQTNSVIGGNEKQYISENLEKKSLEFSINPADFGGVGLENPILAMGLYGITDWSTQVPFINIFKQSRPWLGFKRGSNEWGSVSYEQLKNNGILDENGWVKSVPSELNFIRSILHWSNDPASSYLKGEYILTYKGTGKITLDNLEGGLKIHSDEPGRIEFNYSGKGLVAIDIHETDTKSTGDYIRDISLYRKEHSWLHTAGALFNPDWIKLISDLRSVRFMDWMETNNSTQSRWENRPKLEDAFWSLKGAPIEVMVKLANHINADPWFNIPHLATDKYIEEFASFVRDNLNSNLKAYVEYSNEVWNWQFEQAQWANRKSQGRWKNAEAGWVQFYALKSVNMANIWDTVFGQLHRHRLVLILSTQTGWLGLEDKILYAPDWVSEDKSNNKPPYQYFDAYAVTGYFDGGLSGEEKKKGIVKSWIRKSKKMFRSGRTKSPFEKAIEWSIDEIKNGAVSGVKIGSIEEIADQTRYHAKIARQHDLKLIMYEGGTHVVGKGPEIDDVELTQFFLMLNSSSELANLYNELFTAWHDNGGTMFNAYLDIGTHSKWGSWGALQHLGDSSFRWSTLMTYNQTRKEDWQNRPIGTFDHGIYLEGKEHNEYLIGTQKDDRIFGSNGDDIIFSNSGYDIVHGGRGNDKLILKGAKENYKINFQNGRLELRTSSSTTIAVSIEEFQFISDPNIYDLEELLN